MAESALHGLVLQLIDNERTSVYPIECLKLTGKASTEFFQGQTTFSVRKRDLDVFLDELETMVAKLTGEASIRCGWGEDVYFAVKTFSSAGWAALPSNWNWNWPVGSKRRACNECMSILEPKLLFWAASRRRCGAQPKAAT